MSTLSLPETIENEINALVKGGYFNNKNSFIEEAIKYMLASRGDLKINAAVEMYHSREVSLGRAAELAGKSTFEFKEILKARGIKIVIDAPTSEDMDRQIKQMEKAR
ncbi:MAG: UPF0175 family protein [Methanosarcinales archaeon]|nr:UPF0175 family protein [Methanosarcinales archaeon]